MLYADRGPNIHLVILKGILNLKHSFCVGLLV